MKTIEEASKEYAESLDNNDYTIETACAFMAGVEFAEQWIPIEEELPEPNKYVLVKYNIAIGCSEVTVLELSDDNVWHYRGVDFYKSKSITHWRPINHK